MQNKNIFEKVNKIILPATILLASLILGGFYYLVQANKQKSIERQQQIEIEQKKVEVEQENETQKKEYIANQKDSCLTIYKQESSKWNNVNSWRYDPQEDECYIQYRETVQKTHTQCDADYKDDKGDVIPVFFRDYLLCLDGLFEKTF